MSATGLDVVIDELAAALVRARIRRAIDEAQATEDVTMATRRRIRAAAAAARGRG